MGSDGDRYYDLVDMDTAVGATKPPLSLIERRAFMQLPLVERRRLLAQQADKMVSYYESDPEWRQIQGGDLVEY